MADTTTKPEALAVADRLVEAGNGGVHGLRMLQLCVEAANFITAQAAELETLRAPVTDSPIPDGEWPEGVRIHEVTRSGLAWWVPLGHSAPTFNLPPGTITLRPDPRLRQQAAEISTLRAILVRCASAIGNGACASMQSSLDFLAHVPDEMAAEVKQLHGRLEAARRSARDEFRKASSSICAANFKAADAAEALRIAREDLDGQRTANAALTDEVQRLTAELAHERERGQWPQQSAVQAESTP